MSRKYPSDWDSRRKRVYKRDGYKCQNCGLKGGPYGNAELHAHHIVPKNRGGRHQESNLKTLCSRCHKAVHSKNAHAPGLGISTSSTVTWGMLFEYTVGICYRLIGQTLLGVAYLLEALTYCLDIVIYIADLGEATSEKLGSFARPVGATIALMIIIVGLAIDPTLTVAGVGFTLLAGGLLLNYDYDETNNVDDEANTSESLSKEMEESIQGGK